MAKTEAVSVRRALLIAADTYADPALGRLRAPVGDVNALAEVLEDPTLGAFELRRLINRPTEEIKREIESFFDDARLEDLLLLYVSGHGVLSKTRRFYFATASTQLKWLRTTAVEDGFINDVMQHTRARSVALIVDCCHSGAFAKGLIPKSASGVDVEQRFEGRGRVTLTASTELEYAFEDVESKALVSELGASAPGSVFTRFLVEGLRTGAADANGDGQISVDELYDYLYAKVREHSPHQTPGKGGSGYGDLIIAASARGVSLPLELRQALESPLASVREAAVAELLRMRRDAKPATDNAIRQALRDMVDDDSRRVREAAETALQDAPGPTEANGSAEATTPRLLSQEAQVGPVRGSSRGSAISSWARRKRPRPVLLVALIALVVLVAVGAVAASVLRSGGSGNSTKGKGSSSSLRVTPAPGTALGSDLTGTGLGTCLGQGEVCSVVQYALSGRPTVAEADGFITRWGVRGQGRVALQVVKLSATSIVASAQSNFETAHGGTPQYFRTRLPIKRGDFIALLMCPGASVTQSYRDGAADLRWSNGLLVGQQRARVQQQPEVLEYGFNAVVQPHHGAMSTAAGSGPCPS